MIQIILSNKVYENDVYPLVKAFYPDETIKVYGEQEDLSRKTDNSDNEPAGVGKLQVRVNLDESFVDINITDGDQNNLHRDAVIEVSEVKNHYKNAMKRLLYHMLSDMTQKELPWGILTGIRPTKLVYEMLENGEEDRSIREKMSTEYLCSQDKISMSI